MVHLYIQFRLVGLERHTMVFGIRQCKFDPLLQEFVYLLRHVKGLNRFGWLLPIKVRSTQGLLDDQGDFQGLGNRKGKEWERWKVTQPAFELKYQQRRGFFLCKLYCESVVARPEP